MDDSTSALLVYNAFPASPPQATPQPGRYAGEYETGSATGEENDKEKGQNEGVQEDDEVMHGMPLAMFTVGMMAIVFLMCLGHYILATAIPRITADFNSLQDAAWYSSGYFLTNMALQPAFGQLYQLFSVRLIYLTCLVVFEAGSVLCALAPSSTALIIGRIVTGIGGGGLYIGAVVLRPVYISTVTSLDGVAAVAGPLLGGVFTDSRLTWRFCFWINLPIGFVAFVILSYYLRDSPQATKEETGPVLARLACVDWLSMTLLLVGFSILLPALQWAGPVYPWSDSHVYGCLVGGGLAVAIYFVYQHHQGDRAAIPYRILRQRTVFFSAAFMLLMAMLIGALVYYLPFQFQAVRGNDARTSGVTNLAFLMPLMLTPLLSGSLISLTGWYVPLMYLGGVLSTVGAGLLTTLDGSTSDARLIGYQFLTGFGSGLCHQIPYTSILHVLAGRDAVPGSALCSFLNSLGAILGIVIAQVIFASLLVRNLDGIATEVSVHVIIRAGPTNIGDVVPPALVGAVREAYSGALQGTYILPVVTAGLCCICALGMEWRRLED
ncbi:major facilitator superfamily domain-containing protein [Diplogelasinospora grovesii]|uniref:Major facilitator superfamily domain-containing protein n=1 Tax=Diplogelasinospora grovesii TaxID=303347 RepID=A0AAN6NBS2_9PEZI|nr:major facilitator superfamily domain-containing protein [Diplogelasinospora grovesii]